MKWVLRVWARGFRATFVQQDWETRDELHIRVMRRLRQRAQDTASFSAIVQTVDAPRHSIPRWAPPGGARCQAVRVNWLFTEHEPCRNEAEARAVVGF